MYQINLIEYEIDPHRDDPSQPILGAVGLPLFGTQENLWSLLEKTKISGDYGGGVRHSDRASDGCITKYSAVLI